MQITAVPVNTPQLAARHSPHTIKVHQTDGDSIVVTYPSWLHLALRMGRWASGFARVAIYFSKNRKRELLLNTTQCFASARTCSLMLRFTFNNDSYRCEKRKKKVHSYMSVTVLTTSHPHGKEEKHKHKCVYIGKFLCLSLGVSYVSAVPSYKIKSIIITICCGLVSQTSPQNCQSGPPPGQQQCGCGESLAQLSQDRR